MAVSAIPASEASVWRVLTQRRSVSIGLVVLAWWLFFSRAPWSERLGALVLIVAALYATPHLLHESIRTGMMGFMFFAYAVPVLSLVLVVWAVVTRRLAPGLRRLQRLMLLRLNRALQAPLVSEILLSEFTYGLR